MAKSVKSNNASPAKRPAFADRNVRRAMWDATPEELVKAGWVPAGGGKVIGWIDGRKIVGELVKLRDGQFGPLLIVRLGLALTVERDEGPVHYDEGEIVTVGCPTILASRLDGVAAGSAIYIECNGKIATEGGREAWDFTVLTKRRSDPSQEEIPF